MDEQTRINNEAALTDLGWLTPRQARTVDKIIAKAQLLSTHVMADGCGRYEADMINELHNEIENYNNSK